MGGGGYCATDSSPLHTIHVRSCTHKPHVLARYRHSLPCMRTLTHTRARPCTHNATQEHIKILYKYQLAVDDYEREIAALSRKKELTPEIIKCVSVPSDAGTFPVPHNRKPSPPSPPRSISVGRALGRGARAHMRYIHATVRTLTFPRLSPIGSSRILTSHTLIHSHTHRSTHTHTRTPSRAQAATPHSLY